MIDVIIVGGGAAGLMCAITAARRGLSVTVIESQKSCGKKILLTGKGRCNVTNNCDVKTLIDNIPRGSKFLYSSFYVFTPQDTIEFFESLGVPLTTQRGRRVFPVSEKSVDIRNALVNECQKLSVEIIYDGVKWLSKKDDYFIASTNSGENLKSRAAVIATGGLSYPLTGCTGDGYKFGAGFGHTVNKQSASIVPLVSKDDFIEDLMGLSLRNVRLILKDKNKTLYAEQGEMLFTHFGISGPLVLSASAHMDVETATAVIDLKPALSAEQLDARILRDFGEFNKKDFVNALGKLLPAKMISVVIKRCKIPPEQKVSSITREQRKNLLETIKGFTVNISGKRPIKDAVITRGGIELTEINSRTMESKITKNLHFAGEVIDADGYTGGYNLQIAFSTGHMAGEKILKER